MADSDRHEAVAAVRGSSGPLPTRPRVGLSRRGGASSAALLKAALAAERRPRAVGWPQVFDAVVLFASMVLINLVRFGSDWPTYPLGHYVVGFSVATLIHLFVYYFGGLYEPQPRLGARPWLPRVARATLVAVLLDAAVALAADRYLMPRGNLVALLVVTSLALTGVRHLQRALRLGRDGTPRVVLVGSPSDALLARRHLPETDRQAKVVGEIEDADELLDQVAATRATDVLLLTSDLLDAVYPLRLAELEAKGVGVLLRINGAQTLLGLEAVREVGGMPFVCLQTHTLPLSRARLKRILECMLLLAAAPLLVPLVIVVAGHVRLVAGAPVLFWQDRVGQAGREFSMCKFRTMRSEPVVGAPELTERDHPRVVPACRWLRSTRLDELPQIWHVLRGQMSLVGPRPERPELTAEFERKIAGYTRRYEIPPGITGLAQVQGRYVTDPEYKLGHDLQYMVNWSPARDLQILGRTLWVVLRQRM